MGFETFEKSINMYHSSVVFMIKENDETFIIIAEENGKPATTSLGFNAENIDGKFKAVLNHENACVMRKLFPFTKPVRGLHKPKSFGLGDRLGIAVPGFIDLFDNNDVFPVFAQQSIRELNLTNRTYEDVLDAATFAVFREGYKKGFGADGDHLKTAKDVEYALSLGFTMITLDCSEHIHNDVTSANAPAVSGHLSDKYLNKTFDFEGIKLSFSEDDLRQCFAIYGDAIVFATDIYKQFFASAQYDADFEISIDETISVTTPLQHFFVAKELLDAGVSFATIAPRFCGEFQKGIDYIGDIKQFENEIKVHAEIARYFSAQSPKAVYKLSIHSGSDKFSVFPVIGCETRGNYHVKTAGTNWLEAMRVVAEADPQLYREIHSYALSVFDEARKYYHVTTDLSKLPNISLFKDEDLPKLIDNNEVRQLIHITYGLILNKKNNEGSFEFKDKLYKLWQINENKYRSALVKHIGKHLKLLNRS